MYWIILQLDIEVLIHMLQFLSLYKGHNFCGFLSNQFLHSFQKYLEQTPFQKGLLVQDSKQEVTKLAFFATMAENLPSVSSLLKNNSPNTCTILLTYVNYRYILQNFGKWGPST